MSWWVQWQWAFSIWAWSYHQHHKEWLGWYVVEWVIVAAGAAMAVWWTRFGVRNLIDPRPFLRVDAQGIECAAGRVWWSDVERISVGRRRVYDNGSSHIEVWFTLKLRPDAQIAPAPFPYEKFSLEAPERLEEGFKVPVWTTEAKDLATMRRFYRGPIDSGGADLD